MREALANELFRDRGVAAPRAAFYRIVVNTGGRDEVWGLYTLVEDPADSAMLTSQFGGAAGNLYKPDGIGADWTTFDRAGFEKKTNKGKADFSDIQAAIDALHADLPPAEWRANLERHFDVDLFLRWLAVNQVVDNWDSYGRFAHNYYVYADPGRNGRLVWIPWDNNYSFGLIPLAANPAGMAQIIPRAAGAAPAPQVPVPQGPMPAGVPMIGSNDDVLFEKGVGQGWPLISRLLADPVYMPRYRAHLRFALGGTLRAGQADRSNPRVAEAAGAFSEVGQARVDVWRHRRLPRSRHLPADSGGQATLADRSRARAVRGVRIRPRCARPCRRQPSSPTALA
jgi:hypothetical protein